MNWNKISGYYGQLMGQIYPQPDESGRQELFKEAFEWAKPYLSPANSVIDIGCGEGYAQEIVNMSYVGVAWGKDVEVGQAKGRTVFEMDMHDLDFPDNYFDGFVMSHSWEHSPMPLIMLMEARRVIRRWGLIILPHPDWYKFRGMGHFSVMVDGQVRNLCEQVGMRVVKSTVHSRMGSPDKLAPFAVTNDELWYVVRK